MPIDKPSLLRQRAEDWWHHKQATDPHAGYGGWYQQMAWLTGYREAMRDMRRHTSIGMPETHQEWLKQ